MNRFSIAYFLSFIFLTLMVNAQDVEIYISDAGNFNQPPWQILKFDVNGENPEVFINQNLAWPQDILFLEDQGQVLISNLSSGSITRHAISDGSFLGNFATGISGPTRMKIGPDGLLYVLQWQGNGRVLRYNLNGSFIDSFTDVGVNQGIGLDWDAQGNLYVSSFGGGNVRRFNSNGGDMGLFINSNLAGPTNIWFDDNGDLLVIDYSDTEIKRFDPTGNFLNNFITGLSRAEGITTMPNGNLLIGNGASRSVKMYEADGNYIEDLIPSGSGDLLTPNAVVLRGGVVSSTTDILLSHQMVNPSVGSEFWFNADFNSTLDVIRIFHINGQLIDEFNPSEKQVIYGDIYESGLYFLIGVSTINQQSYIQKIIIN